MSLIRSLALLFLAAVVAHAQTGFPVAGFGYRTPANVITAAPGQVMLVSAFGIVARIPNPIFPVAGPDGFPSVVQGISIDFVQGPLTVALQIRGVQQTPCPLTGSCTPATTFTIQIPFELNPDSRFPAVLRLKESGAATTEIALNAVTDSVHIIDTCDQTGIYLSLANDIPAGVCAPMVMHAHGPLVSASAPARPGETLVIWAYGLGAVDRPILDVCCSDPAQLPLAAQPFDVSLLYLDALRPPLRRLAHFIPSYAGMVGGGLYQVQFAVPALPSDIGPCFGQPGNLAVQVHGPASSDVARLCAQP